MTEILKVPFNRSYWVVPGKLLAGAYPGSEDPIEEDFSVPTERQMVRILNQIDMCIKYDKSVYVHCWGGKGRTGTAVGCYLARNGIAASRDAIEMIKELRKNTENFSDPSPETKEQINMVIKWERDL
jgi:protein-tyrosine phosphatase